MEWLKAILEKAEIKDGKLDVDAVMNAAQKEFPKHAVPKDDFNNKVKELETANDTITELKKSNGDNADLQKKIGEYETEIKDLKYSAEKTAKTYALKESLAKQGVLDPDYLIYKAGGLDKFNFDKEGKPVGVASVNVNMGGVTNTVSQDTDLDGVISYLANGVTEALQQAAEGVHS